MNHYKTEWCGFTFKREKRGREKTELIQDKLMENGVPFKFLVLLSCFSVGFKWIHIYLNVQS